MVRLAALASLSSAWCTLDSFVGPRPPPVNGFGRFHEDLFRERFQDRRKSIPHSQMPPTDDPLDPSYRIVGGLVVQRTPYYLKDLEEFQYQEEGQ